MDPTHIDHHASYHSPLHPLRAITLNALRCSCEYFYFSRIDRASILLGFDSSSLYIFLSEELWFHSIRYFRLD